MGTTLDHMTGGQWGLNVVTGFHAHEMAMLGLESVPRDQRYFMAAEFTLMLSIMWRSEENVTMTALIALWDTYVSPKPLKGRPIIVSACSSEVSIMPAAMPIYFLSRVLEARYCRRLREAAGANPAWAEAQGRIITPHVICRETEKEVADLCRAIVEAEDAGPPTD